MILLEGRHLQSWRTQPKFLREPSDHWPVTPLIEAQNDISETKKVVFCGLVVNDQGSGIPDASYYTSWKDLIDAAYQFLHGAASQDMSIQQPDYRSAETLILSRCQGETFSDELKALKAAKPVPASSRLNTLAPELDCTLGLIRVGGRLRKLDGLSQTEIHPVVLHPHHKVTKLLIKHFDERLLHPGPDRVFAELRRHYWILRGRQAVRQHQRECVEC